MPETEFGEEYYANWYGGTNAKVQLHRAQVEGRFIVASLEYFQIPIRNILDVGCGFGHLRNVFFNAWPDIEYVGIEVSGYLCERFGWRNESIVNFKSDFLHDLVVCRNVLQYLDDEQCNVAISRVTHITSRALFLEVITESDAQKLCDPSHSDINVYKRSRAWYASRLSPSFVDVGGGLFLKKSCSSQLLEIWCRPDG